LRGYPSVLGVAKGNGLDKGTEVDRHLSMYDNGFRVDRRGESPRVNAMKLTTTGGEGNKRLWGEDRD